MSGNTIPSCNCPSVMGSNSNSSGVSNDGSSQSQKLIDINNESLSGLNCSCGALMSFSSSSMICGGDKSSQGNAPSSFCSSCLHSLMMNGIAGAPKSSLSNTACCSPSTSHGQNLIVGGNSWSLTEHETGPGSSSISSNSITPMNSPLSTPISSKDHLRQLFEACKTGDLARVKHLGNARNVNARDTSGRKSTPLHFAAGKNGKKKSLFKHK